VLCFNFAVLNVSGCLLPAKSKNTTKTSIASFQCIPDDRIGLQTG